MGSAGGDRKGLGSELAVQTRWDSEQQAVLQLPSQVLTNAGAFTVLTAERHQNIVMPTDALFVFFGTIAATVAAGGIERLLQVA